MNAEYVCRKATKDAPCFVCNKFSYFVLRNDQDWFFTCSSHLLDGAFCRMVKTEVKPPEVKLPDPTITTESKDKKEQDATNTKKEVKLDTKPKTEETTKAPTPDELISKKFTLTSSFLCKSIRY